jgi:hypothetical protein
MTHVSEAHETADVIRENFVAGFTTVLDALDRVPENMTAREAAAELRELLPTIEGRLVHAFDQRVAGAT